MAGQGQHSLIGEVDGLIEYRCHRLKHLELRSGRVDRPIDPVQILDAGLSGPHIRDVFVESGHAPGRDGIGELAYGLTGQRDLLLFGRQLLRSEEHTSELQSLMRISYAVFCLKKKNKTKNKTKETKTYNQEHKHALR